MSDNNTGTRESAYRTHMQSTCPHCGALQNVHDNTQTDTDPPENGDISFCAECGRFSAYAKQAGRLRKLKAREHRWIAKDHACTMLRHQWRAWRAEQTVQ